MPKVKQAILVVDPKVVRCLEPIGKVPHWAVMGMSLMRVVLTLPVNLQVGLKLPLGRRKMFMTSSLGCLAAVPGLLVSHCMTNSPAAVSLAIK
jgi:hypothetical protein